MPLDFPNTPGIGSQYSLGGKTWTYNGTAWDLTTPRVGYTGSAGTGGGGGYTGSVGYTGSAGGGGSASGYSTTIGNGSTLVYTVTHNLASTNIVVTVIDTLTNYIVYPDIHYIGSNSINVEFAYAPASSQYRVSVLGYSS